MSSPKTFSSPQWADGPPHGRNAFTFPDFLVVLALLLLLLAVVLPMITNAHGRSRQAQCIANLGKINRAVLDYAEQGHLPQNEAGMKGGVWWFYKELIKGELGVKGPSSPADKVFACPNDRGYEDGKPFRLLAKFDYGSYVFNGSSGASLPNVPSVAGRTVASIKDPSRTLLVTEWSARAPLSWHHSRTGRKNHPFYNDAESEVGFVDGHVDFIPIYYDGLNAAYTRDPVPGYQYKFSAD